MFSYWSVGWALRFSFQTDGEQGLTVSGAEFLKDAMAGAKQIARAAQIAAAAQRGEVAKFVSEYSLR